MTDPVPNPGSNEARAIGCWCPRMDNNHGSTPPIPPELSGSGVGGWYIALGCPVHTVTIELADDE